MNHRMILFILSRVLLAEAVLLAGSACVGLLYGESVLLTFGVPVALLLACAAVMWCFKPRSHNFYARDGMVAVSLAWILMSAFGALPFWLSGYMPSYVDCFLRPFPALPPRALPCCRPWSTCPGACCSGAPLRTG